MPNEVIRDRLVLHFGPCHLSDDCPAQSVVRGAGKSSAPLARGFNWRASLACYLAREGDIGRQPLRRVHPQAGEPEGAGRAWHTCPRTCPACARRDTGRGIAMDA